MWQHLLDKGEDNSEQKKPQKNRSSPWTQRSLSIERKRNIKHITIQNISKIVPQASAIKGAVCRTESL